MITLSPEVRKLALTAHVTFSVGWLGAVVSFLALALTGIISEDVRLVQSAYMVMEVIGTFVLVPLSVASLLSGLVQALGTPWGLFRHYWVVAKLVITLFSTIVLLMYRETLSYLGDRAAFDGAAPNEQQTASPVLHAVAALILLLVATTLSIYKPRGLTRYGQRGRRPASPA